MANDVVTIGSLLHVPTKRAKRYLEIATLFKTFIKWKQEASAIPVDRLYGESKYFCNYLRNRSQSELRFLKYANFIPRMFEEARKEGWVPDRNLSLEWQAILHEAALKREAWLKRKAGNKALRDKATDGSDRYWSVSHENGCACLVRYFARLEYTPATVTHEKVVEWLNRTVHAGVCGYLSAARAARAFETVLLDLRYDNVNKLRAISRVPYTVPLREIPQNLRKEVKELVSFRKQDPRDWDLPDTPDEDEDEDDWTEAPGQFDDVLQAKRRQLSEGTAYKLEKLIWRLYGCLCKDPRLSKPETLRDMFARKSLLRFKTFLRKERKLSRTGVFTVFATLIGTARQYPSLADQDWYDDFLNKIEKESIEEQRRRRWKRASIPFRLLEGIPNQIDRDIAKIKRIKPSTTKESFYSQKAIDCYVARLRMRKFLIQWMLEIPWTPKYIFGCRVNERDDTANLFKLPIKIGPSTVLPLYVEERMAHSQSADIWQIHFSEDETSGCGDIQMPIPELIERPLEAYLGGARKDLLKIRESVKLSQNLFLGYFGQPMDQQTVHRLVIELTLRYIGTPINPQAFRDIWAFHYLDEHRDCFKDLALCLWQLDSRKTEDAYGKGPVKRGTRYPKNRH